MNNLLNWLFKRPAPKPEKINLSCGPVATKLANLIEAGDFADESGPLLGRWSFPKDGDSMIELRENGENNLYYVINHQSFSLNRDERLLIRFCLEQAKEREAKHLIDAILSYQPPKPPAP